MNRLHRVRLAGKRGIVSLPVLVMLAFLVVMVTLVMEENAQQRRYLRSRQDGAMAISLAESGAQDALRHLAANPAAAVVERQIGRGRYRAQWSALPGQPATYEIVSVGLARPDVPDAPRRTVRVRVTVTRTPAAPVVKPVSWVFE